MGLRGRSAISRQSSGEILPEENPARRKVRERRDDHCFEPIGTTLALSEGWENALAWRRLNPDRKDVALAAAIDLGNLSGQSTGTIELSFKGKDDKPTGVQNGIPNENEPGVILPDCVKSILIIADNDSEPLALLAHILTAVRRWLSQGIEVVIDWAPAGLDFNDVLLGRKPAPGAEAFRHPGGVETSMEFLERARLVLDPPPPPGPEPPPPQPDDPGPKPPIDHPDLRPTITLRVGETERAVNELESLLIASTRSLYQRGGLIVSTGFAKMQTWDGKTVIVARIIRRTRRIRAS